MTPVEASTGSASTTRTFRFGLVPFAAQKARADFAQQAHDEADAAQEALDSATEALDQLESDAHHGNRLMPPIRRSQQREPTKMPPTRQRKRRMKPQGQ